VNRSDSIQEAEDTIDFAIQMSKISSRILGVDFSGNPESKSFSEFRDLFEKARLNGLKTTIHFAEVFDSRDTRSILEFKPDRVGHGCCLSPPELAEFLASRIPLEVCPTSNLMTRPEITSYESHPVGDFIAVNHPISINTDDRGVFNISLSDEYHSIATAFNLSRAQLSSIAIQSMNHAFCDSSTHTQIISRFYK
jgi:adenosine deaminase